MNRNPHEGVRILGSVRAAEGTGIVRVEDSFDEDIDTLWSYFTEPGLLARWLGTVEGDLRQGNEFRATFFASGWEGIGRVEVCVPQRRLVIRTMQARASDDILVEIEFRDEAGQTSLAVEHKGMPLEHVAGYGAGNQIHLEDLAAALAGDKPCDARVRWEELRPFYEDLAAAL